MIRRTAFVISALVFMVFGSLAPAFAQVDPIQQPLAIVVSPKSPAPYQQVQVTARSFSADLNSSDIRWVIDGKTATDTIGGTSYSFTAKGAGVATKVSVAVTPPSGSPLSATVTIVPAAVDLIWQVTDSTVPPLYRGKALPTSESVVRYVAMPALLSASGMALSPSNLVYTWKHNYVVDQNGSGYAKNAYTVPTSYLNKSERVDVDISSRDGSVTSTTSASIATVKPKILWYAASPVYGPRFEAALTGSYDVIGSDTSILAEPYFFSPGNPASPKLSYEWKLNGKTIDTPYIPNTLFLHRDSNDTGTAQVSLSVSNATTLFQEAVAKLTLHLQ